MFLTFFTDYAATASSFAMGDIRLLFVTDAYGMGTDVHDIRRIMHTGPPMSLESKSNYTPCHTIDVFYYVCRFY